MRSFGLMKSLRNILLRTFGGNPQPADTPREADEAVDLPAGFRMFVHPEDDLGFRRNRYYEVEETALCERLVKHGDRVLDVGANIGYFTLLLARLVGPDGEVFSFEPDPEHFSLLTRSVALNGFGQVRAFNEAAGAGPATLRLYRSGVNSGMHRLYESVVCSAEYVTVPVCRIDAKITGPVDFIKLDIEGYEWFALRGMDVMVRNSPNVTLLMEFSPLSMWEAGYSPLEVLSLLEAWGMNLHRSVDGAWRSCSLSALRAAIERLPETEVLALKADSRGKSFEAILHASESFLRRHDYPYPMFENILLLRRPLDLKPA